MKALAARLAPLGAARTSAFTWPQAAVALAIAAFLLVFLVVPVVTVVYVAFADGAGGVTLSHFGSFFSLSLMRESFWNSLYVGVWSVGIATLIAVPLAYFTVRFEFRGAALIQTLGVLPLIMPPFVGAVAMQLIFGRSGAVNLLLNDWFGFTLPIMEGLNGVIFVEALHYFPFILMNLVVALNNIDSSMEESAQNLGASGMRLFRRIVFPLAMPGYVAGAALVFCCHRARVNFNPWAPLPCTAYRTAPRHRRSTGPGSRPGPRRSWPVTWTGSAASSPQTVLPRRC